MPFFDVRELRAADPAPFPAARDSFAQDLLDLVVANLSGALGEPILVLGPLPGTSDVLALDAAGRRVLVRTMHTLTAHAITESLGAAGHAARLSAAEIVAAHPGGEHAVKREVDAFVGALPTAGPAPADLGRLVLVCAEVDQQASDVLGFLSATAQVRLLRVPETAPAAPVRTPTRVRAVAPVPDLDPQPTPTPIPAAHQGSEDPTAIGLLELDGVPLLTWPEPDQTPAWEIPAPALAAAALAPARRPVLVPAGGGVRPPGSVASAFGTFRTPRPSTLDTGLPMVAPAPAEMSIPLLPEQDVSAALQQTLEALNAFEEFIANHVLSSPAGVPALATEQPSFDELAFQGWPDAAPQSGEFGAGWLAAAGAVPAAAPAETPLRDELRIDGLRMDETSVLDPVHVDFPVYAEPPQDLVPAGGLDPTNIDSLAEVTQPAPSLSVSQGPMKYVPTFLDLPRELAALPSRSGDRAVAFDVAPLAGLDLQRPAPSLPTATGPVDPDLAALARTFVEPLNLVWVRHRRGERFEVTLYPDGSMRGADGSRFNDPTWAANALSGGSMADGWRVWRVGADGPSLAELDGRAG